MREWAATIGPPTCTDHLAPDIAELPVQWGDFSEADRKRCAALRRRKLDAQRVADILAGSTWEPKVSRAAEAMRDCANRVRMMVDADSGDVLSRTICCLCHGRWCPVCVWQRALTWRRLVRDAVAEIETCWPDTRWLLLTLTARNCKPEAVRAQVTRMHRAFARLAKRKRWPGIGYVRAMEVTRGRDGSAHVHFHVLVAVPSAYFRAADYVQQCEWVGMWKTAMQVDYDPVVYVQAVKADRLAASAVGEAMKYPIKLTERALGDAAWLGTVVGELWAVRVVGAGGVCRLGLMAARRNDEMRKVLRRKDLEGRRVVLRWYRWTGADYLPAAPAEAAAWTLALKAMWAGVTSLAA